MTQAIEQLTTRQKLLIINGAMAKPGANMHALKAIRDDILAHAESAPRDINTLLDAIQCANLAPCPHCGEKPTTSQFRCQKCGKLPIVREPGDADRIAKRNAEIAAACIPYEAEYGME